mmetsp:Transcript_16522/g.39297  ORF Transcript_16522/g.39297 Transcript_16522/m.39297 type:complete len:310 (-) Transcript_16522:1106-2035(-)
MRFSSLSFSWARRSVSSFLFSMSSFRASMASCSESRLARTSEKTAWRTAAVWTSSEGLMMEQTDDSCLERVVSWDRMASDSSPAVAASPKRRQLARWSIRTLMDDALPLVWLVETMVFSTSMKLIPRPDVRDLMWSRLMVWYDADRVRRSLRSRTDVRGLTYRPRGPASSSSSSSADETPASVRSRSRRGAARSTRTRGLELSSSRVYSSRRYSGTSSMTLLARISLRRDSRVGLRVWKPRRVAIRVVFSLAMSSARVEAMAEVPSCPSLEEADSCLLGGMQRAERRTADACRDFCSAVMPRLYSLQRV